MKIINVGKNRRYDIINSICIDIWTFNTKKSALSRFIGIQFTRKGIFGSVARGEQTEDSDIDI
ncbi:MAG: nucleotidyltransferase domain-containing protein, partial [Bacteroidales bacterium]